MSLRFGAMTPEPENLRLCYLALLPGSDVAVVPMNPDEPGAEQSWKSVPIPFPGVDQAEDRVPKRRE